MKANVEINSFIQNQNNLSPFIKLNNQTVEHEEHLKFLGILLDSKLKFQHHIDMVCNRLANSCFLMRQLRSKVSEKVLGLAYLRTVQIILMYDLMHWCSSYLHRTFIIQKRMIRTMIQVFGVYDFFIKLIVAASTLHIRFGALYWK